MSDICRELVSHVGRRSMMYGGRCVAARVRDFFGIIMFPGCSSPFFEILVIIKIIIAEDAIPAVQQNYPKEATTFT